MATVKVKFRASIVKGKEGTLYYQVIHNRIVRQIHTGYRLFFSEWNARSSEIILDGCADEGRRNYLLSLKRGLSANILLLSDIIVGLEQKESAYHADHVVELYNARKLGNGFISFSRTLILQLRQVGKLRTSATYNTTINSFIRFRNETEVLLEEMDSSLMVEYEEWLKSNGICPNTTSFYMRNLRAIYNRAVEEELTMQRHPFKHVYTRIDKTVKRAVSLNVIRRIRDLDLADSPLFDYARDIFMFSFYTRGMSFVDMAFLKKKNLQDGILSYRRQKTNQQMIIRWEKPMQEIVNKYDTSETPYLLPIIKNMQADEWRQYKTAAHLVNVKLKKLGQRLDLGIPLTSYVARHAWASIAKSKNVPISIISEAMGHDSENTTRIYLASLDASVVDRANRLILSSL